MAEVAGDLVVAHFAAIDALRSGAAVTRALLGAEILPVDGRNNRGVEAKSCDKTLHVFATLQGALQRNHEDLESGLTVHVLSRP